MTSSPKPPHRDSRVTSLFATALSEIRDAGSTTGGRFETIEPVFLRTMATFDEMVADGTASQGDIQNGKGDFFNDVLQVLLEHCSGKKLHTRPRVPGLSFPNHMLDIAYPATGPVTFTIETKATETVAGRRSGGSLVGELRQLWAEHPGHSGGRKVARDEAYEDRT